MNILATIGSANPDIAYVDRPTVKVVVRKAGRVLLLNQGLLPGGGIDEGETQIEAITRELQEELGMSVTGVEEIGAVIQYREYLGKRYVIYGYAADFAGETGERDPQDEGEAGFIEHWLTVDEARKTVQESIAELELNPGDDDAYQGRVYNLRTSGVLLGEL